MKTASLREILTWDLPQKTRMSLLCSADVPEGEYSFLDVVCLPLPAIDRLAILTCPRSIFLDKEACLSLASEVYRANVGLLPGRPGQFSASWKLERLVQILRKKEEQKGATRALSQWREECEEVLF